MKTFDPKKPLGIVAFLLTALTIAANAQIVTLYSDNFNSYTAGTTVDTARPSGPGWTTTSPSSALADNGQSGAGDLYIQGSSTAGVLTAPQASNEFETYSGGGIPRYSNGQYLVFSATSYGMTRVGSSTNYSAGNDVLGIGQTSSAMIGGFDYNGTATGNGGVGPNWYFSVYSGYTASGSAYTFNFAPAGGDQWVNLYVQVDGINGTVQGFLQSTGGVLQTPLVSLNPAIYTVGSDYFGSKLRQIVYRTDTRNGTFGINADNLDVYQSNSALSLTPEPSTFAMIALGLVGLWGVARRRRAGN